MRIVGGTWRGRALTPLGKGAPKDHLRPTSDRVRESLFNVIEHGQGLDLDGVAVLDLFAGTGALGLEALSRGADFATFVDQGRAALRLIEANIALLGASQTKIIPRGARSIGANPGAPAGLVFLDPPYGQGLGAPALKAARAAGWIAAEALVIWEEHAPQPAPGGFTHMDHRRYGETHVTFLEAQNG